MIGTCNSSTNTEWGHTQNQHPCLQAIEIIFSLPPQRTWKVQMKWRLTAHLWTLHHNPSLKVTEETEERAIVHCFDLTTVACASILGEVRLIKKPVHRVEEEGELISFSLFCSAHCALSWGERRNVAADRRNGNSHEQWPSDWHLRILLYLSCLGVRIGFAWVES